VSGKTKDMDADLSSVPLKSNRRNDYVVLSPNTSGARVEHDEIISHSVLVIFIGGSGTPFLKFILG
jgi:hypothetical protein